MSLKYLAIKETMYNLPKEDKIKLVKEIITNFSRDELIILEEEIDNIHSKRESDARQYFDDKVNNLTKIALECRDWRITSPRDDYFTILWEIDYIKTVENVKYPYKLSLEINEKKMEIRRRPGCSCFTPYICNDDCYMKGAFLNKILGEANINGDKLEIHIEDEELKEWTYKTLLLYSPLFFNFRTLYDEYFAIRDH